MTAIGVSTGLSLGRGGLSGVIGFVPSGIVAVGDSITAGQGANNAPWPTQFAANTGQSVSNVAVVGQTLLTSSSDAFYNANIASLYNALTKNTMFCMEGTNDINFNGATDSTVAGFAQTLASKARATGFRTVFGTIPSRSDGSWNGTMEGYRVAYNGWLRANWAAFCDGLVDFAGLPESQNSANTVYFQNDLVHPTNRLARPFAELVRTRFGLANINDTTPNAFNLVDITGAATSTVSTSAAVELSGFTAPTTISVTGGTYSINGGAFTSSPGTVQPYDLVQAQVTTSASSGTGVSATITAGGVSDAYTVTTASALALNTTPAFGTATYSLSNTKAVTTAADVAVVGTVAITGKVAFGALLNPIPTGFAGIGVGVNSSNAGSPGFDSAKSMAYYTNGALFFGSSSIASPPTYTLNANIGVVVDRTANLMWFTKDGTNFYGTTGPLTATQVAAGTSGLNIAGITGTLYPMVGSKSGTGIGWTIGAYQYTLPSGYGQL